MSEITFTKVKLPYGWMCNMSPHEIWYDDEEYRTAEALFQALRFDDESIRKQIRDETSPMAAKFKAKAKGIKDKMVVEPMSDQDLQNMMLCLTLKVSQHPELKQELLDTGDAIIIEDATSRGRKKSGLFWGAIRTENGWEGENMLGECWMALREKLQEDAQG